MISSNSHKFLIILFFALMLTASCKFFQSNTDKNKTQDPESEIQTNIPFSTKEPETFQAEFVVTTFLNDEKTERKYFVAKKGEKLLTIYGVGNENEVSYLLRSENESFLINHSKKTIQKRSPVVFSKNDSLKNEWRHFLVTKLLNEKHNATFEKIGTEDKVTKYLVKPENSKNSEVLVFIKENTPFPIKQEFYSISGDKKTLSYSVEIKNYKTEVDDKFFELPENHKEIN